MDANQFKKFMEQFSTLVESLAKKGNKTAQQAQQPCASGVAVPLPSPLALKGDMAENFEFFERSWLEYSSVVGMHQ